MDYTFFATPFRIYSDWYISFVIVFAVWYDKDKGILIYLMKGEINMSEDVFFNPGQSISSDFDYNKAYVAAQIYHEKVKKPVLVVKEEDNKPFIVFNEEAAIEEEHKKEQNAKQYKVVKRIDD